MRKIDTMELRAISAGDGAQGKLVDYNFFTGELNVDLSNLVNSTSLENILGGNLNLYVCFNLSKPAFKLTSGGKTVFDLGNFTKFIKSWAEYLPTIWKPF